MIFGDKPEFDEMMEGIRHLEHEIKQL